jgi:hypothetical protein
MLFTSVIGSLALLLSSVAASPVALAVADNPSLEITGLVINDTSTGMTLLKFNVSNPESLADQDVAVCNGTWNHQLQNWPVGAKSVCDAEPLPLSTRRILTLCLQARCTNSETFTWFMDSWTSARQFTIAIQDRFDDPS